MTLFGYGKTTQAIAQKFKNITIYDDKFENESTDEYGNTLLPSHMFDANKSALEIPSPGISPSNPLIKKAKNLISEYDLFFENMPYNIWISGTNGKTTTTKMLDFLLGDISQMGGNVGTPVANLDTKKKIWILESSSFTLHYTNKAYPNIYILLPIKEDHTSWHGSFDEYKKAKLKPLSKMQEGDVAIIPQKFMDTPSQALKIPYENSKDLANYFDIDISKIKFKDPFLMDAILAMAIEKILYDKVNYEKINSFVIEEHRLEELKDTQNRLWVNDTKATNVDATVWALRAYEDKKIYIILGGDDKGADLTPLFNELKTKNVEIFATGTNKQRLSQLSKKFNIKCELVNDLKEAIHNITKLLDKTSVCLLSPAAASLDEYSSYEQRGNFFKALVKQI